MEEKFQICLLRRSSWIHSSIPCPIPYPLSLGLSLPIGLGILELASLGTESRVSYSGTLLVQHRVGHTKGGRREPDAEIDLLFSHFFFLHHPLSIWCLSLGLCPTSPFPFHLSLSLYVLPSYHLSGLRLPTSAHISVLLKPFYDSSTSPLASLLLCQVLITWCLRRKSLMTSEYLFTVKHIGIVFLTISVIANLLQIISKNAESYRNKIPS